jgi:type II secretory pathway pseudopilin PulG
VLLCTLIVVGTLLTVLFLNIQMSGTSYQITRLQGQTQRLTDQAQVLQETNDQLSTPQELEKRATDLGMVPAGSPAYIDLDSGTVVGDAVPVTDSTDRTDSGVVPASRAYPTDEPYHGMGNSADEGE